MAVKKKGLGQGLEGMLLGSNTSTKPADNSEENVSRETLLNINKIEPNRLQPRKVFNEDALQELADSIKLHGIIQPIVVQKQGDRYMIIAGERRWRAARLAKLKEVPVVIKDYSAREVYEIALIENLQRQDLNKIEEAKAYQSLIEEYKVRQEDIAERVSKSRTAVTNALRLLKLDERVQQMVIDEMISGGHARALLSLEDKDLQYETANRIFDENLSVRETEKLVKKLLNPANARGGKKAIPDEAIYRGYEDNIRTLIGSKIEIQRKDVNKGKLIIDFSSADEFEKIYGIIVKGSKE